MKQVKAYNIKEMLLTEAIMGNKSKLARLLNVDRATLRKLISDVDNKNHIAVNIDGKWSLMVKTVGIR